MNNEYSIIQDSKELRRLIAENPDLPIAVLAGDCASSEEWPWTYCVSISCGIQTILDIKTPYDHYDGTLFTDIEDFEECIADAFYNDERYKELRDQEIDEAVGREAEKYKEHWKKVIAIYANN
jgi:hypothetical protein